AFAPSAEQELICMPPVTALHRPGTPHRGSSTFAADSAATRCTPPFPGQCQQAACGEPDGAGVQEQGGNARQPGAGRFGAGQVGRHRLHTLGQAGGPGAADDGTDPGALVDQEADQGTSDGTGRSGYQDHAKASYLHGCLNKIQYWGKYL